MQAVIDLLAALVHTGPWASRATPGHACQMSAPTRSSGGGGAAQRRGLSLLTPAEGETLVPFSELQAVIDMARDALAAKQKMAEVRAAVLGAWRRRSCADAAC